MSNFNKVGIFMKTFGQEVKNKPSFSTDKINKLRIDLIKEELQELTEAMNNKDLLEVADALTEEQRTHHHQATQTGSCQLSKLWCDEPAR